MSIRIRYTYDIVTPESAEDGEASERGWLFQGSHYDVSDETASEHEVVRASEAARDIPETIGYFDSVQCDNREDGMHVTIYGSSEQDPYTCESETRCAHFIGDRRLVTALLRRLAHDWTRATGNDRIRTMIERAL